MEGLDSTIPPPRQMPASVMLFGNWHLPLLTVLTLETSYESDLDRIDQLFIYFLLGWFNHVPD